MRIGLLPLLTCAMLPAAVCAGDLDIASLQATLEREAARIDGRVGVCVASGPKRACVRGDEAFSLQSVMKLLVGAAVLDRVDRGERSIDGPITIHRKDLSLSVQPVAEHVGANGYRTTIGELIRRAIIDSDSAAVDVLLDDLGGAPAMARFFASKGIAGMRIDRDERHLQTEIDGLEWRAEFVDPKVLDAAVKAVPREKKRAAYLRYQQDPRDRSTPRAMTAFLERLHRGQLLSKTSTAFLLRAMDDCATGADRLKAGLKPAWKLGHKTGTSGSFEGATEATNDVGILSAPDGGKLSIAVFVAGSRATAAARAAAMARISAAAIAAYRNGE